MFSPMMIVVAAKSLTQMFLRTCKIRFDEQLLRAQRRQFPSLSNLNY
jgi:hypothetical protein